MTVALCFAAAGGYAAYIIYHAPPIDTSAIYSTLTQTTEIYDDQGKLIETINEGENRENIALSNMDPDLINAFVALEDKTFWEHHGFNVKRIIGAIKNSVFGNGSISGTSTITQQLARNIYLKNRMSERSLDRKITEAWYTIQIERDLSKEQIIEAYLNTINLGYGNYGVQAASKSYFKKKADDLTPAECAALAALPQAPTDYALVKYLDKSEMDGIDKDNILKSYDSGSYIVNDNSKDRRETCLYLMRQQGYLTEDEYKEAVNTPLNEMVKTSIKENDPTMSYFTDYLIDAVIEDLMEEENLTHPEAYDKVYGGGLKIYSTLNTKYQKIIKEEFNDNSNYPPLSYVRYNSDNDIVDQYGNVVLFKKSNVIDDGKFKLKSKEINKKDDGSLVIKDGKRISIYEIGEGDEKDVSIELPVMYKFEDGKMYSINGGYILGIPAEAKTYTEKGNVIISAEFMNSEEGKAIFKKDGPSYYIPKEYYQLNQSVIQPQSAMTIIENKTGYVKAMVGGRKTTGQKLYNRAVETRQPGSSIKPLTVYSAALQQSFEEAKNGRAHHFVNYHIDKQGTKGWGKYITAHSTVVDERTTNNGHEWPRNSGGGHSGKQTFRSALRQSLNTCAYKIWMQVGVDYSVKMAKKYGLSSLDTEGDVNDLNAAALSLGGMTNGVSTLEMANAYTVFPNNGDKTEKPIFYTKVTNQYGTTILKPSTKRTEVLDPGVAWIMADIMKDVVSSGTGTRARVYGTQAGGKTGTTSTSYDVWFDGFTPELTASLWIGNDYNIMLTGMSEWATGLWGKIMNQIPEANDGSYKDRPDDVQYIGGEYYVDGTYGY